MRHQTDHVALAVANPRDGVKRTVWIRFAVVFSGITSVRSDVMKNNLVIAFKFGKRGRLAKIVSLVVRSRNFQNLSGPRSTRERRVNGFNANVDVPAKISQPLIADHCSRQKPRFQQDLKAVADPQDQAAGTCEPIHRFHHRGKTRNSSRAQIIAEGKAAWENDGVQAGNIFGLVPDELNRLADDGADGMI